MALNEIEDLMAARNDLVSELDSVRLDLELAQRELDEVRAALGIPSSVRLVDGVQRLKEKMRAAKRRAKLGLASR